jgi:hypothetical protein
VTAPQRPAGRVGREARAQGLLLVRGEQDVVARWAERGLVAAHTVPLDGWTAVLPAEPTSLVSPPYDDARAVLAARPLPSKLRPSIGLFALQGRAVVTVQPAGWRAVQRWLVWTPGQGVARTPRLPLLRPVDLVRAAGAERRQAGTALLRVLRDRQGPATLWLLDVMRVLGLPGEGLLTGEHRPGESAGAVLVEPSASSLARFESILRDEAEQRAEREEA